MRDGAGRVGGFLHRSAEDGVEVHVKANFINFRRIVMPSGLTFGLSFVCRFRCRVVVAFLSVSQGQAQVRMHCLQTPKMQNG